MLAAGQHPRDGMAGPSPMKGTFLSSMTEKFTSSRHP